MKRFATLIALVALTVLGACAAPPQGGRGYFEPDNVAELTRAIQSLGPDVDPEEAARAAEISYTWTRHLAREYEITDPPLIHNMKVNSGLRPRGLCWQWAEDMEARLNEEHFKTLDMHRAIAHAFHPIFIEHSTAIISAKGDNMYQGIVLDPWREGGTLTWERTLDDKYPWVPKAEVMQEKRERRLAKEGRLAGI